MNRVIIVCVMILSLIGSGLTRRWSDVVRGDPVVPATSGGGSLAGMDSYALALLLGGLRGPLVMFLWSSSETQKTENNLEDFDLKVEWIRLLQPEFDTVHIFQIWNKAYNISVKMTNLANKYATILDALDYAHKVDAEKPNNINIVSAIGGIYFDKFGNSAEKVYYRARVRNETLSSGAGQPSQRVAGVRRTRLDPVLNSDFKVLPELYKPRLQQPLVHPTNPEMVYDGSELQFLPQFEPFPYGVSPFALAYNYHRRAMLLQEIGKQRHAQLSDLVMDSRPALSLRYWADEEVEFARRAELAGYGNPVDSNADPQEFVTTAAAWALDRNISDRARIEEAIFEFDRAAMLYARADEEYAAHVVRHAQSQQMYESHRAEVQAYQAMALADRDFLKAAVAPANERTAMIANAIQHYTRAANLNRVVVLRYSVWDAIADQTFPPGVTRRNISEQTPNLEQIMQSAVPRMLQEIGQESFYDDAGAFMRSIDRAVQRLAHLQAAK